MRTRGLAAQPGHRAMSAILKVPEITVYFWIVKLLTTAMGESTSDYLVFQINPYVAVVLGCIGLAIALILQFAARRYVAGPYWFAVAMVAVFGTMVADVAHVVLHIPYLVSTAFFASSLGIVFVVWYANEKTLSIHSIYAGRREMFYWATVMATFALGTAAGDMTASTLGLGYFPSFVLFAVLFAIPALAYWRFGLNEIVAFWFAYVVTRPLGASFADWLGKPYLGGLGLGDEKVAVVLTILIIGFVGYLTVSRLDIGDEQKPAVTT
ncbi:MAG: COG4705 family protein [Chloroflexota bacterium]